MIKKIPDKLQKNICIPHHHAGKSRKVVASQCTKISYYLANKQSLYVRSQGLKIPTLIGENKKIKITYHCHYNKNQSKIPLCLTKYNPSCHYKETKPICNIVMRLQTTSVG